jgi:hypothetical protein
VRIRNFEPISFQLSALQKTPAFRGFEEKRNETGIILGVGRSLQESQKYGNAPKDWGLGLTISLGFPGPRKNMP